MALPEIEFLKHRPRGKPPALAHRVIRRLPPGSPSWPFSQVATFPLGGEFDRNARNWLFEAKEFKNA